MRQFGATVLAIVVLVTYILAGGTGLAAAHPAPSPRHRIAPIANAVRTATTVDLVYSNPPQDAALYQRALAYLGRAVSRSGEVLSAPGTPASIEAAAKTAVALHASGKPGAARIAAWLAAHEDKDGGFGPYPGTPPNLQDTAYALWAMAAADGNGKSVPVPRTALRKAEAFILTLSASVQQGGFYEAPGIHIIPAEANAVAVAALTALPAGGVPLPPQAHHAVFAAALALNRDDGVMRHTPTDFIAGERWNLWRDLPSARRQVASLSSLGMAYAAFGAKTGPGYLDGMDWVNANQTFNLAIAAAAVGLRATALAEFTAGLGMANPGGGFGAAYHPPVGPETGTFSAGPGPSSPGPTADFLLAADALIRDHILGLDGTTLRVLLNGRAVTEYPGDGAVDPPLSFSHRAKVAVLVSSTEVRLYGKAATSATSEAGLSLNLADELVRLGYPVTLFWYKPNQAGPFHPLADLWPHLDQFQILALGPGTFLHDDGYGPAVARHHYTIGAWIRAGGRLLDVGDPHGIPLRAPWALTPTPIAAYRAIRWNPRVVQAPPGTPATAWTPLRPVTFSRAPGDSWAALAWSGAAKKRVPVAVGRGLGRGRVVLTGLGLGTRRQDGASILATLMAWETSGLSVPKPPSVNITASIHALAVRIEGDFRIPGTNLFTGTASEGTRGGPTYLWPLSQLLDGSSASGGGIAESRKLAEIAAAGLPAYWNTRLTPPGYAASPVASGKGGLAFYDDNGWTALALIRLYNATGNPTYLARAEALFAFMASGWSRKGGEYFNVLHRNRTQTATGTFLELALRLYRLTHRAEYLNWAKTATAWDRGTMKGPTGLYWDSVNPSGAVKGPPLPYDTGVVLVGDVLWYQTTKNPLFLARARELADEALTAFTNPLTGLLVDPAGSSSLAFNAVLLHGIALLNAVAPKPAYRRVIDREADSLADWDRLRSGLYGSDASGLARSGFRSLLVQAAVLKILAQSLAVSG